MSIEKFVSMANELSNIGTCMVNAYRHLLEERSQDLSDDMKSIIAAAELVVAEMVENE